MNLVHSDGMAKPRKKQFTVHEAKTHLSKLLQRVVQGEEIIIAKGNIPVARLQPIAPFKEKRDLGRDRGLVWISPDFDSPLDPESFE